jgi:uncharacterized protein (TIGR01319 family)
MPESEPEAILATDCGSTTTKAILIERRDGQYRLACRGEAPTTVEAPFEDVTRGVLNSVTEVEELSGRRILDGEKILRPSNGRTGVDIYASTSSAGGGLQMMVAGVIKSMTAESAQRAALGAGAIVMDVLSVDDGRAAHEKISRIRQLRPDMILLSGGTDGGTISHVVELAQYIHAADPKPRFGLGFQLPVIYAGNRAARDKVGGLLGGTTALTVAENIRPTLEQENLQPVRHKIHDLFLEHVMAQAPGYRKLMDWTTVPIMPTPGAVGLLMERVARERGINVIGVDIGGATTDTFSVFDGVFNRTVSANLGMSYNISNVMVEAGLPNILRWVPFDVDEQDLRNRIKNKMIRPTTVPQTVADLVIEHAIAREALRLALDQHRLLAVGLKGVQRRRTIGDIFEGSRSGQSLVDMSNVDLLIGSGGVLSHAPRRIQSMMMLIDAYQPVGATQLAVDSIFMMPHLGVLSVVHPRSALEVFERDCLIHLGACIAPAGRAKPGQPVMDFETGSEKGTVRFGEVRRLELAPGETKAVVVRPAKGFDAGEGPGQQTVHKVTGGVAGLILDGRGRPLQVRKGSVAGWFQSVSMIP